MGFTPCKAEQPLQGMELKKKKYKKITAYRKSATKEPTVIKMSVNSRFTATKIIGQQKHSIGRKFLSLAVQGKKLLT